MSRRLRVAVLSMWAVVVAGGCGLPIDDEPRAINPESVPFRLLEEPRTEAPVPPSGAVTREETVFLVAQEGSMYHLQRSTREIPTPVNLGVVLQNLMAGGRTEAERELDLANFVPAGSLASLNRNGTELVIDVAEDFFARLGSSLETHLALAQIVLTATSYEVEDDQWVEQVSFTVRGEPRLAPTPQGLKARVTPDDFSQFVRGAVTPPAAARGPEPVNPTGASAG